MEKSSPSKTNIFLIELIIVILVFAVASAIIINLFISAHKINDKSQNMSISLMKTESIIEEYKSLPSLTDGTNFIDSKGFPLYFDKDWKETKDQASYVYKIDLVSQEKVKKAIGTLVKSNIEAYNTGNNEKLINMTFEKYFAN